MKGIICGDRCDDGEHNNQPCDDNDAASTMTATKKTTTTLTMTVMTMTTAVVL
jgi:hypothetical protein